MSLLLHLWSFFLLSLVHVSVYSLGSYSNWGENEKKSTIYFDFVHFLCESGHRTGGELEFWEIRPVLQYPITPADKSPRSIFWKSLAGSDGKTACSEYRPSFSPEFRSSWQRDGHDSGSPHGRLAFELTVLKNYRQKL